MLQRQRRALEKRDIVLNGQNSEIHFGVVRMSRIALERYTEIRPGRFDVGFIGAFSYLGGGQTILRNVSRIGRFCALAANINAGPLEHPSDFVSAHSLFQGRWNPRLPPVRDYLARNAELISASRESYDARFSDDVSRIDIGNDVWIGEGAFIRRGVTIGNGAVIGARSVVVKDVPDYAIVAGQPAKVLRMRFDDAIVERLLNLSWWEYGLSILDGVDMRHPESAIDRMEENLARGHAVRFDPGVTTILENGQIVTGRKGPEAAGSGRR